jgi:SAM-dependent methyltransferase
VIEYESKQHRNGGILQTRDPQEARPNEAKQRAALAPLQNPSRTKRYINYACGDWAQGVAHLRDLGWNVVGFEPFQDNASPHIARSAIDPLLEPSDGVFTHNYLEHIQDPDAFIRDCLRFLTPDGTMAHSTPCYEYRFAQSPFHLYFFCGNSMDRLVQRHGFRQTHRVTSDNTPQTIGMAYEFRAFARDRASAPSELAP